LCSKKTTLKTIEKCSTQSEQVKKIMEDEIRNEDLTECDREAIHLIGHIQGECGNCIFVNFPAWEIIAVDVTIMKLKILSPAIDNATLDSGWTQPNDFLGLSLKDVIPNELFSHLEEKVQTLLASRSSKAYLFYKYQGSAFAISVSSSAPDMSILCFEFEELNTDGEASALLQAYTSMSMLMDNYSEENVIANACDRVFDLIGRYDRGMVYRFNDDYSGEVIHEIKRDHINSSYLGLRFPSSDIPKSSRLLYFVNRVRYIHSNLIDPIELISKDNITIDQSLCQMRAVAKPHVIYLKQMGVISSMSMALVVDDELWGLFSFHAYTEPYKPSLQQRLACESIATVVSVRVEASLKKTESSRSILLGQQISQLDKKKCVIKNISEWGTSLLGIIKADVFVSYVENRKGGEQEITILGNSDLKPTEAFWDNGRQYRSREIIVSSSRRETSALDISEGDCPASGFVYFRESRTHFFLGRSERCSDVCWGGNPDEPKLREDGVLCPRKSFDMYMEKSRLESKKWTKMDVNVISILRDRLCEHCYDWNMMLLESDIQRGNRKYIAAIRRAQDNYEFFARMSHEIRTPFHGVMGCLSLLCESLSQDLHSEPLTLVNSAIASGNHMLKLLNDIQEISKTNHEPQNPLGEIFSFQNMADQLAYAVTPFTRTRDIDLHLKIEPQESNSMIYVDSSIITLIVTNCMNDVIKAAPYGSTMNIKLQLASSIRDVLCEWRCAAGHHTEVILLPYDGNALHDANSIESWFSMPSRDQSVQWLIVSISYNGYGIRANELNSLYFPSSQSSNLNDRNVESADLGLHISVSLCQLLNGFISCASTQTKENAIAIGIPINLDKECETKKFADKKAEDDTSPIDMVGGILVVDDHKVNVKILKRTIELECNKAGKVFEIICAYGGEEAVNLYMIYRPSVCFIDYHMPEVDGILATRRIRRFEADNLIPDSYIMSYTADTTSIARNAILASGANGIMNKPPPKGLIPSLVKRMVCQVKK
jgi:two-component system, chemotaxis family, sensor kinase Cph1